MLMGLVGQAADPETPHTLGMLGQLLGMPQELIERTDIDALLSLVRCAVSAGSRPLPQALRQQSACIGNINYHTAP